MSPILAAASEIEDCCTRSGWRFCFIGGLAVLRWGEPRLTRDVDLTIVTGFGGEEPIIAALLDAFESRVGDAPAFAMAHRVLLLRARNGVPIDAVLGALAFEERAAERASSFPVGAGRRLRICSAEDLIVLKAFAGRDRDWADIEGVALRQAGRLDEALIWEELLPLLEAKEARDDADRLARLLRAAT